MLPSTSFSSVRIRATALSAMLTIAVASAAPAAVTAHLRSEAARVDSPQWFLSHLDTYRAQRNVPGRDATTYPLNGPFGLTVAPNGDLYVANLLGNQVLVYGSNLLQKTARTISTGLTHPSGVALDSRGEVFVSNIASNAITVYSSVCIRTSDSIKEILRSRTRSAASTRSRRAVPSSC